MTKRRKSEPPAAPLEIMADCKEYVIDYLERAFPTRQMRVFTDDTGAERSVPMDDENGNPVYNPQALAARANLIEQLCALPPITSALDGLLNHFGHDNVAEITGRTKRLIQASDGRQKLETRSTRTSQAEAAAFMGGLKRILIFSDAGGTGRSYHASLDAVNQEQRAHLLLEPGWRADRAIQGLGRTHRTHQACTPLFRPVTTDCKGELRFTSTIARRLDTLGALTRGQRQTGGQNLFDPADNLESSYACAALTSWFHLLHLGKLKSTTLAEFEERTGLELTDKDGVLKDELPPIQRWLNRLLALPIGLQNRIFEEFLALVETRVQAAREAGRLDVGVETMLVDTATIIDDTILRTDPVSGATSHLLTIEVARRKTPVSLERILRIAESHPRHAFLRNAKSGLVALQVKARAHMEEKDGTPIPRIELMRPTRNDYMRLADLAETAWSPIDEETFRALWAAEAEAAAAQVDTETIRLATGLLLPIWSALPSDHLVVNRIADQSGQSWLGRIVFDDHVVQLYTKLGLDPRREPAARRYRQVRARRSQRRTDAAVPDGDQARRGERSAPHRTGGRAARAACLSQIAWLLHRDHQLPHARVRAGGGGCRHPRPAAQPRRSSGIATIRLAASGSISNPARGWVSSMAASAAWVVAAPALSPACSSN